MAKKSTIAEESKGKLQDALDHLDKAFGKGTVLTLDGKVKGNYDVISSGSLGMDYVTLGVGGWVFGKLYELIGWEGSGKSTLCGHAVAECQKVGKVAMYIDGEHAVDKNYFRALGVDTTKMLISQPSSGEEGFQIAKEMISSGKVDLIIIDSDSSLIPKAQVDGDIGDSVMGKKARLNGAAYPSLKSLLVQHKVCMIVISQFREKIGVMFGNPETTQGGHTLKFYSDCRLEIRKSTMTKDGDVSYGNITKVKAIKNKMCPPYRTSQFDIVWGVGIDRFKEILDLGVQYDVVLKQGSWFSYGESKIGQGTKDTVAMLKDNPELTEEIRDKIIEKIMGADILVEEPTEEVNEM